jgi:hypothetical protein
MHPPKGDGKRSCGNIGTGGAQENHHMFFGVFLLVCYVLYEQFLNKFFSPVAHGKV